MGLRRHVRACPRSFNELEAQLRIPHRWEPWVGPLKPSADTLGYALERSDPEGPRAMLATVFFTRNLKPHLREGRTRLHLAQLLYDDLVRGGLESFWAQPP